MEVLLFASILVALLSLLGIFLLVMAALFCMPPAANRKNANRKEVMAAMMAERGPTLVMQVTAIDDLLASADNATVGGVFSRQISASVDPERSKTCQIHENSNANNVPRSAPTSTKSPQYVPMHAVTESAPASAHNFDINSPKSIPSDWFGMNRNDDAQSFTEIIGQSRSPIRRKRP